MSADDFDIDSLTAYLHLSPQQVARLADRGKLPGRKVGGQWRFSRAEVHHWLEQRIGLSDEDDLVDVEGVLKSDVGVEPDEEIVIAEMLPRVAIEIPLRARENMFPTALDNGVALLHPRRPLPGILGQAFLALGCTPNGIPFGGSRGGLTDVFFLICSVEDRGHLRTLSRLSRILTSAGFLEALRLAPDAAAAHQLVVQAEAALGD
jgi:PTS system nitrogen regulatory IIA component